MFVRGCTWLRYSLVLVCSDGSTASDSLLVRTEVPTTALDAIEAEEDEEYLEYLEAQYANYLLDEELSYSE